MAVAANRTKTVWSSAARTTTPTKADIAVPAGCKGVAVTIDTTAASSPSTTPKIQVKDTVSGKYIDLLAGVAITGTGTVRLVVYPGCIAVTNLVANLPIGGIVAVDMGHGNSNSHTYSVGIEFLV